MIKMSVLLLVGLTATTLLRKRSAAARHWMLAIAIACAAATPLLERVVPIWRVPVTSTLFDHRLQPLALLIPIHEVELASAGGETPAPRFVPIQSPMAARVLGPIWMAGLFVSLSILLVGFARLAWLASRAQPVTDAVWLSAAHELSRQHGVRGRLTLLQSDHPTLLVTWGAIAPKIILPAEARHWSEERMRIVLAHELAHIRRGDWLVQLAAELFRAVYWFNPLLWIACRQLRRESEHACDDAVLALGVEGSAYASTLLDLARAFRRHRQPAFFPAPAMARPSTLEKRVKAMLNQQLNRTPLSRTVCIATVVALLTIALPIAGVVGSAQATAQFSGTLVDAVGRVLPDTPMVLSNTASGQKHQGKSDSNGRFAFTGLAGGDYVLEVERLGFATTQGRVSLAAGQSLLQDVALQLGSLQETITITDGPPAAPRANRARNPNYVPEPSKCTQTTVGGCIDQPMKLRDVKPVYPPQFSGSGRDVALKFEARIGVDGFINDLRVVTPGNPEFATAAADAIRQWEFSQTRLDGVPVEVKMNISVTFRGQQ